MWGTKGRIPASQGIRFQNKKTEERPEDVVAWVERRLGFVPDAVQARVLRSRAPQGILNCTRQWGKSTVTAAKAVHEAWTKPGSLTLVASPTERQSAELVRKAGAFARRLGVKPRGDGVNSISLQFPNGSRVIGLPGTDGTIRGFSAPSLILLDEASRVPDATYFAMTPMMATSPGSMWLMSTPFGKRGFFWETWASGDVAADWERIQVTAEDCPRISAEFLARERGRGSERWFRQEYFCEFVAAEGGMFDAELVEGAMSDSCEPIRLWGE